MSPATASVEILRARQLERLRTENFDLAVVGGGINGAAIARDAAMRGLCVALVDRGDFAGATSSHSSKLIHGGLRYLPQGQLRLVREALRERERLRTLTAPHLVHSIRFLFPLYRGRGPGRCSISAGLFIYDLMARAPAALRHRRLSATALRGLEPALASDALSGGALYFDGWGDDARLTWENALDASLHGAAIANYVAIEGFSRTGARITAAAARDLPGGESLEIHARHLVNATGPWLDELRRLDDPGAAPGVRLTKGVHLVVNAARLPVHNALVLTDAAGRVVFLMPRDGWVMIGTTDTDFDGDRENLRADDAEIGYLLEVVNAAIPAARLEAGDVAYSFAGLRALETAGAAHAPSRVSREEIVIESASGLLSIAGGKLTTHRAIAQKIVDELVHRVGRPSGACPTLATPLPGARGTRANSEADANLPGDIAHTLASRYGTRAAQVVALLRDRPELAAPIVAGAPALRAEVIYAIRAELATTVSDFLVRRTAMAWRDPASAIAAAPAVGCLMGAELGWDDDRIAREVDDFFRTQALHRAAAGAARPGPDSVRDSGEQTGGAANR